MSAPPGVQQMKATTTDSDVETKSWVQLFEILSLSVDCVASSLRAHSCSHDWKERIYHTGTGA